jgi:hypothetical protein
MKKGALILLLGLLVSGAAFAGFYYLGTQSCRALMSQPQPELAWLKKECPKLLAAEAGVPMPKAATTDIAPNEELNWSVRPSAFGL